MAFPAVGLKVAFVGCLVVALVTLELLAGAGVNDEMAHEAAAEGTAEATDQALIRLLPRVNIHVLIQVCLSRRDVRAQLALVNTSMFGIRGESTEGVEAIHGWGRG